MMESLFKIVFQNGEFLEDKSSFLGISYDTIFTVVTTILIFFLGYIVNRRIEIIKENKRLNELEEYFIKLIELLEEPLLKQKEALIELTKKLKENIEQHYFIDEVSSFRVDLIKEIENRDLYDIFIKRKKGKTEVKTKLFQKIRGQIDYLDEVKKSISTSFEELMDKSGKYETLYKENLKITSEAFENILTQNELRGVKPKQDPFLVGLENIRAAWMQTGTAERPFQDRYLARQHYLEPVLELCKQSAGDPRATFVLKHILESINAFDNIEEVKCVYRKHFLQDARGIQKGLIEIKSALNKFSAM